jgi:hypothetical protein
MTYDIVQTTFLLSIAANGAAAIQATQTQLQGYLEAYLNGGTSPIGTHYDGFFPLMNSQLAGGDWGVVWGPCLYSVNGDQPGEATNAMYVAHSAALSTYVVAVAATNFKSVYDWFDEDFDVAPNYMAEWPPALPFVKKAHLPWTINVPPAISASTALGLSNLLTQLSDPSKGSLQKFLGSVMSNNQTLIFCGHSLAGALSPTLALYLYPQPAKSGWKQVLVLPTAGATPGNGKFAALFNAAFPPVSSGVQAPYGNWNTDYANANDAVPHAWNHVGQVVSAADAQGNYPSMYGVIGPQMGKDLYQGILGIETTVALGFYTNLTQSVYQPTWGYWNWTQNQDGSWQYPPVWTPAPVYTDSNPIATMDKLLVMVQDTHVDQYSRFFGVTPPPRMPSSLSSKS